MLRQEHRGRGWRMGRQPGRAAVRRDGLHGRIRSRTPIPGYADLGHRWRNHRNPHRIGRQTPGVSIVTVLQSTLDPKATTYTDAAAAATSRRDEIDAELAKALAGGGPK